jgi:hypothetical protein
LPQVNHQCARVAVGQICLTRPAQQAETASVYHAKSGVKGPARPAEGKNRSEFRDKLVIYYPNARLFVIENARNSQIAVDSKAQKAQKCRKNK